jgi:hypothetical protein
MMMDKKNRRLALENKCPLKFLLIGSFQKANYLLSLRMGERRQADFEKLIRLPVSTTWPSNKATWVMSGFDLKMQIEPTDEQTEGEIIRSIIGELRTGLSLPLEQVPSFDRKVPAKRGEPTGSRGKQTTLLSAGPGWPQWWWPPWSEQAKKLKLSATRTGG